MALEPQVKAVLELVAKANRPAYNTSTAFSPTDSPVLSQWAKILMMVQALISFTTVALLAARAINIL